MAGSVDLRLGPQWPNAFNTGVPAGTSLSAYSGPSTITSNGTVIDSKTITSCIVIQANNVTIRNCNIPYDGCFWNILSEDGNTGLLIEDCDIDGLDNLSADSCVAYENYTLRRCNITGNPDGLKVGSNTVIEDCYIHDLAIGGGDPHADGAQCLGTTSLTIRHNTFYIPGDATSCIILSTGSASDMRNINITNNLMAGGVYCVYGGYQSGVDDIDKVSNISITNNWISTSVYANGGNSGPFTSVDSPVVHTGNRWYDGPDVGEAID